MTSVKMTFVTVALFLVIVVVFAGKEKFANAIYISNGGGALEISPSFIPTHLSTTIFGSQAMISDWKMDYYYLWADPYLTIPVYSTGAF